MPVSLIAPETNNIQLNDYIDYLESGVLSKVIWKDSSCQYSLFCLAADTEISEHSSIRNATIMVIEGNGLLIINSENILLEAGVFAFIPAKVPHALTVTSNLAFVLTLTS